MMKDSILILGASTTAIPWGDYGRTLSQGYGDRNNDGVLELRRSAPFIPPISFPGLNGDVVLNAAARHAIEQSGLAGIGTFRLVEKCKIVDIRWHEWDFSAPLAPEVHPPGGEPENYIEGYPHSPLAAELIGDLWSWEPEVSGSVSRGQGGPVLRGIASNWEVFRVDDNSIRCIFLRPAMKKVLEQVGGKWIECVENTWRIEP